MDNIKIDIDGVSNTLFLPLYSRAIESQTKDPIINDQKSVEIVNHLDKIFSKSTVIDIYIYILKRFIEIKHT